MNTSSFSSTHLLDKCTRQSLHYTLQTRRSHIYSRRRDPMCLRDTSPHMMDLSNRQHKCKCHRVLRNVRLESNKSLVYCTDFTILALVVAFVMTVNTPFALFAHLLASIALRADALVSIIALLAVWTRTSTSHCVAFCIVQTLTVPVAVHAVLATWTRRLASRTFLVKAIKALQLYLAPIKPG